MDKKLNINAFYNYLHKTLKKAVKKILNKGYSELNQKILLILGSGIMLPNIEIDHIIKVIKSVKNTEILLKGTTRKIKSQEGGFLANTLSPLIRTGLPLTKNVLTPLPKRALIPLGLTAAESATDAAVQKKIHGLGHPGIDKTQH